MVRWLLRLGFALGVAAIASACHGGPHELTVTTTADGTDAVPGDGVCEMTAGVGDCSLRAAIDEANVDADIETITVPSGTYALTESGSDDVNALGDLDVDPLGGALRIAAEAPGAVVDASGEDGALDVRGGEVVLTRVAARGAGGSGLTARTGAAVLVSQSALHGNAGTGLAVESGATASLLHSTVSTNGTAGVGLGGTLHVAYTTVTANTNGGIVGTGSAYVHASVVGDQVSGRDCLGVTATGSLNLQSDGYCAFAGTTAPAALEPLSADPVPSHTPRPDSAVLDVVDSASVLCGGGLFSVDQHDAARPVSDQCDLGAVEVDLGLYLVVDTPLDDIGSCVVGSCSLREAILEANQRPKGGDHVIEIAPGVDPDIELDDGTESSDTDEVGDLDTRARITIEGNGAVIDAHGHDRVLDHWAEHLTLRDLVITGGEAESGGGMRALADATLERVTIEGNTAGGLRSDIVDYNQCDPTWGCAVIGTRQYRGWGGGLLATAPVSVIDSTIVSNVAKVGYSYYFDPGVWRYGEGGSGGGIYGGPVDLQGSTIAYNTAEDLVTESHSAARKAEGGGVDLAGTSALFVNSTVAHNVAEAPGGQGAGLADGTFTLEATTIAANSGTSTIADATAYIDGSIVDGSCAGSYAAPGSTSSVSSESSCLGSDPSNIENVDPLLGPLADNGGPTPTMAPDPGSPAVDHVSGGWCGELPTDQRGEPRSTPWCDAGSVELTPLVLEVDSPADAPDSTPGDGVCDVGAGACTLRAAITEADLVPALETTIIIAAGVDPTLSLGGPDEDGNLGGDLDVASVVTVVGDGAVVDAAGLDRVFDVHGGALAVDGLIVTGGRLSGVADGAGIRVGPDAALVVRSSTITDNRIPGWDGHGGGVYAGGSTATVVNSTISDNFAFVGSALHRADGTASIASSTLAGGGGWLLTGGAAIDLRTSVLGSGASYACGPTPPTSSGFNVVFDGSCTLTADDVGGVDPLLGPLQDNGGATPTQAPAAGSPAIDLVPLAVGACADGPATDQRGGPRPLGLGCDAGAVEGAGDGSEIPLTLVVNHGGDALDTTPGDGTCQDRAGPPGACSLRAAIDEANAHPAEDLVTIDPSVATVTLLRGGRGEDDNATGDLDVTGRLLLDGNGATVDAVGLDRVFDLRGDDIELVDLEVVNGVPEDVGGGIRTEGGSVTITASTVSGNSADSGGGIHQAETGELVVQSSTIADNTAALDGGGLHLGYAATVTDSSVVANSAANGAGIAVVGHDSATVRRILTHSTVSDNEAAGDGGGIQVVDGWFETLDSTVSGNTATTGGGLRGTGDVVLNSTTVVANQATVGAGVAGDATVENTVLENDGPECQQLLTSNGHNLAADLTCGLTEPTDLADTPALLGVLDDNGGPTRSHLPFEDSAAVDSGTCQAGDDQRHVPRPYGADCDRGAVEGDAGVPGSTLLLLVNHGGDDVDAAPGDGLCQDATGPAGACSLRAAIDEANAMPGRDRIELQAGLGTVTLSRSGGDEDANATGDLDLLDDVEIDGNGAALDAADLDRDLDLWQAEVQISGLTVTGGDAGPSTDGGGIRSDGGSLSLADVELSANRAGRSGGGAWLSGTGVTMTDVDVTANEGGGARIEGSDGAVVADSSFVDNAGAGLDLEASDDAAIESSTFAGNLGVGLQLSSSLNASVVNSTIVDNESTGLVSSSSGVPSVTAATITDNLGAAASQIYGPAAMNSTIVDGLWPACSADLASLGNNLSSDESCALDAASDVEGEPALLEPLADNGGPTPTRRPYASSPAVGAIPAIAGLCTSHGLSVDQRGSPRGAAPCDIGAVEGSGAPIAPLDLIVTHGGDDVDSAPGDGVCQDSSGPAGACSLRAAVAEANERPTPDRIGFAPGVSVVTLARAGADEDRNDSGDLDIRDQLRIDGSGGVTIDAAGLDRVLHLLGAPVELVDLTVTGGSAVVGGGIYQEGSVLSVDGSAFTGNHADSGGGLRADSGPLNQVPPDAATSIVASTFSGNTADVGGGVWSDEHEVRITGSTFGGNDAPTGAALSNQHGVVSVANSTVSGNVGGSAIAQTGREGSLRLEASTVASNGEPAVSSLDGTVTLAGSVLMNPGRDCVGNALGLGIVQSEGYNVSGDSTCGLTHATDQQGVVPYLGPLVDNGGPTLTHLPLANSPALDVIPVGTAGLCDGSTATDQRGVARPEGSACDVGAVEGASGVVGAPLAVTVNHGGDVVDSLPGDGVCQDLAGPPGACSLRAALLETNAWPTADTLTFLPDLVVTMSIPGEGEDQAWTGDLDVNDDLVIAGNGATVDGAGLDDVLAVDQSAVDLSDLTIRGGKGRGIDVPSAGSVLAATEITVTDNAGGGIYATGPLALTRSTVSDNSTTASGGGIQSWSTLTITASTISGNTADGSGGGIWHDGDGSITASTIAANTAGSWGDSIYRQPSGQLLVTASVVQSSGVNCEGAAVASGGYDVASDGSCPFSATGDQENVDAMLGPLADNGGPTETHRPALGSPSIDAIPSGATSCPGGLTTDQRGEPRPFDGACDVGAVETAYVPQVLTVDSALDGVDVSPGDGVCDAGGGACTLRAALTESNASGAGDTIAIAPGVDPVLALAGSDEDGNLTGDLDITAAVTIEGGGATVDADQLDRVVDVHAGSVVVHQLVIEGGRLSGPDGGAGLRAGPGTSVVVDSSTLTDNRVGGFDGYGGGIHTAAADLTVTNSTLSDNFAWVGAAVNGAAGSVDITASTLAGGGGWLLSTSGSVVDLRGSILGPGASYACSGAAGISSGYNVVFDTTCGPLLPGDEFGVDPLLGALGDNGGPTPTQLPAAGSPAVDAVPAGTAGLCDGAVPADQRGFVRPYNGACDVGAVERQAADL